MTTIRYQPLPPFRNWPRQWVTTFGFVWLSTNPPIIATQSLVQVGDGNVTESLQDIHDEIVSMGFLNQYPKSLIVHDWRSVMHIEPSAREVWKRRAERNGKPFSQTLAYVALHTSSLLRMAARTSALLARFVTGLSQINIVDDPKEVLDVHHVQPPPFGLLEKIRASTKMH